MYNLPHRTPLLGSNIEFPAADMQLGLYIIVLGKCSLFSVLVKFSFRVQFGQQEEKRKKMNCKG